MHRKSRLQQDLEAADEVLDRAESIAVARRDARIRELESQVHDLKVESRTLRDLHIERDAAAERRQSQRRPERRLRAVGE